MLNEKNRLIVACAVFALAGFLAWVFHSPDYLWLLCLMLFARRPKQARKAVHERFEDIDYKLEQLAQLITKRETPPAP